MRLRDIQPQLRVVQQIGERERNWNLGLSEQWWPARRKRIPLNSDIND